MQIQKGLRTAVLENTFLVVQLYSDGGLHVKKRPDFDCSFKTL